MSGGRHNRREAGGMIIWAVLGGAAAVAAGRSPVVREILAAGEAAPVGKPAQAPKAREPQVQQKEAPKVLVAGQPTEVAKLPDEVARIEELWEEEGYDPGEEFTATDVIEMEKAPHIVIEKPQRIQIIKENSQGFIKRWPEAIERWAKPEDRDVVRVLAEEHSFFPPFIKGYVLRGITDIFRNGPEAGDWQPWQMHGNWPYMILALCRACGPNSYRIRWYGVDATPTGGDPYIYSPAVGTIVERRPEGDHGNVVSVYIKELDLMFSFLHVRMDDEFIKDKQGNLKPKVIYPKVGQVVPEGVRIARYGGVPTHISATLHPWGRPVALPFQELVREGPTGITRPSWPDLSGVPFDIDENNQPKGYWPLVEIANLRKMKFTREK
jgi:hypothetical protein